jgi:hypothetical protein
LWGAPWVVPLRDPPEGRLPSPGHDVPKWLKPRYIIFQIRVTP